MTTPPSRKKLNKKKSDPGGGGAALEGGGGSLEGGEVEEVGGLKPKEGKEGGRQRGWGSAGGARGRKAGRGEGLDGTLDLFFGDLLNRHSSIVWDPGQFAGLLRSGSVRRLGNPSSMQISLFDVALILLKRHSGIVCDVALDCDCGRVLFGNRVFSVLSCSIGPCPRFLVYTVS